jgi:hypothetical protein
MPYKIINTLDVGVPMYGTGTHWEKVTGGLDKLEAEGWKLVTVVPSNILIFHRPKHWRKPKRKPR